MPNPGHAPTARHRIALLAAMLGLATTLSGCLAVTPAPATLPPGPSPVSLAQASPSPAPFGEPTAEPTPEPTDPPEDTLPPDPTLEPFVEPTPEPTPEPTQPPAPEPTLGIAQLDASVEPSPPPGSDAGPTPMADSPELADRLQKALDKWRKQVRVPGIVAAMRFPDGSVWASGSGKAILGQNQEKATADTPWVIASITKTFVAALAFQLQEEGKLTLDTPISTWLPDWPQGDRITVRMLMNHTSGIGDYFWHPKYKSLVYDRPTYHWTVDEILQLAGERPRRFPPGSNQEYSNTNYILLGVILEMVGGKPLAEQLRERFFDPLGLTSVVFQGDEPTPPGAAKGYWWDGHWTDWSDGTPVRPSTSTATVTWSAGAILASARDLLRWEQALYSGEILSSDSLHQLLDFQVNGYGAGSRIQKLAGWEGYGHGGSLRGFISGMYRLPFPNLDIVLMINRGDVATDPTLLMADLVKLAVGRKPGTGPKKHPKASAEPSPAPSPLPSFNG